MFWKIWKERNGKDLDNKKNEEIQAYNISKLKIIDNLNSNIHGIQ